MSIANFVDYFGLQTSGIFFWPQYVWFSSHIGVIANSSGQLAELIVYTISLE